MKGSAETETETEKEKDLSEVEKRKNWTGSERTPERTSSCSVSQAFSAS